MLKKTMVAGLISVFAMSGSVLAEEVPNVTTPAAINYVQDENSAGANARTIEPRAINIEDENSAGANARTVEPREINNDEVAVPETEAVLSENNVQAISNVGEVSTLKQEPREIEPIANVVADEEAETNYLVVLGAFLVGIIATLGGTKLFGKKSATATKE